MKASVLIRRWFLSVALLLSCTSCLGSYLDEQPYGISRFTLLEQTDVDIACIGAVLRKTPEITKIDAPKDTAALPPGKITRFSYQGTGFWVQIRLEPTPDGLVHFTQERVSYHHKPSPSDLKLTRTIMLKVEATLGTECGLSEFAAGVAEECYGMKCPT